MHYEPQCNLNTTYHILARKQTTHLCQEFKLTQFQIHLPSNILTLPNRLTVKFHYSLTLNLLAPTTVGARINP